MVDVVRAEHCRTVFLLQAPKRGAASKELFWYVRIYVGEHLYECNLLVASTVSGWLLGHRRTRGRSVAHGRFHDCGILGVLYDCKEMLD